MFIRKLPSPSMSMTVLRGCAACAPIADGRPKPIEPRPPLVTQCRGWLKWKYCAAHIWCWPTPVVTMVSSSWPRSRRICHSRWMAYCGRMASSRSAKRSGSVSRQCSIWRIQSAKRPPRGAGGWLLVEQLHQVLQGLADVADDRQVGDLVLVDLRRVDVDVDDLAVLGELAHLAGDAVVEADAEGQQQVGVVDGVVGVDGAVHAEHVQAEEVLAGEAAQAEQRQGHRDAGALGERLAGAAAAPLAMMPPPA